MSDSETIGEVDQLKKIYLKKIATAHELVELGFFSKEDCDKLDNKLRSELIIDFQKLFELSSRFG
jgi:hypothetical protein